MRSVATVKTFTAACSSLERLQITGMHVLYVYTCTLIWKMTDSFSQALKIFLTQFTVKAKWTYHYYHYFLFFGGGGWWVITCSRWAITRPRSGVISYDPSNMDNNSLGMGDNSSELGDGRHCLKWENCQWASLHYYNLVRVLSHFEQRRSNDRKVPSRWSTTLYT